MMRLAVLRSTILSSRIDQNSSSVKLSTLETHSRWRSRLLGDIMMRGFLGVLVFKEGERDQAGKEVILSRGLVLT